MTTNLGSKIIERESGIKPKTDQGGKGFKITPDVSYWGTSTGPIKDPELFQRVTKLVMDELKLLLDQSFKSY
jgi:hypothetical protein